MAIKTFFINSTVATYSDEEFAWFQSLILNEGIIGDPVTGVIGMQVIQNGTPDMSVLVGIGKALVELTKSGRTFKVVVFNDAQVQVTIPANASGINRVDAIIVRVDKDVDPNISKTNVSTIERVAGTGATALTDGAIDTAVGSDGWYRLANVTVTNGDVAIITAEIADTRTKVAFSNGMAFSPIFISTSTGAPDASKVPLTNAAGVIDQSFFKKPVIRKYELTNVFGTSTTQFDISFISGTTYRYTWDGTGTDPTISAVTVPIGTELKINGQNFTAANNGNFVVTGSGANYFEVSNASGVAELNKTLGTGAINYCWIKPAGLSHVRVKVQAGGGGSGSNSNSSTASGGGGGYTEKVFAASALGTEVILTVGKGGTAGVGGAGGTGGSSSFGTHLVCNGGAGTATNSNSGGAGGTVPTPGDFSLVGGTGSPIIGITATSRFLQCPGMGRLTIWTPSIESSCADCDFYGPTPTGYGYGGPSHGQNSQPSAANGVAGGQGVIIIEEYYN